jgi:phospholipid/cholesterol/gamma-HCH transport system substrate-binding protein
MITRLVRIQVLVFIAVSLLGVAYVGVRYVGLGDALLHRSYSVGLELPAAGGIFPNASVAYRGVPIGRVGDVRLDGGGLGGDGVRVTLRIDRDVRVPSDLLAVVAQRSAVGEQYVDLRPNSDGGPYLRDGDTIPRERASIPLPMETLLSGLDALVRSVGVENLSIVVDELGRAFAGNEAALRTLLDANSALLHDANQHLPELVDLIHNGQTVLDTQADSADAIKRWAAALARLSQTLRDSDGDLRRLLAEGPPAAAETVRLLHGLDPSVGVLLGNLVTVNDIAVRRLPGIEQILVVYPIVVAGGFTVAPGDGTAHLGLVVNVNDPSACTYPPGGPPQCSAEQEAGGSGVRGSANAPRAGGGSSVPASQSSSQPSSQPSSQSSSQPGAASVAGFDPGTGIVLGPDGQPLQFGDTGGQYQFSGDQSWKQLLFSGLAP